MRCLQFHSQNICCWSQRSQIKTILGFVFFRKTWNYKPQNFILLFEYADTFFFNVYTDKGAETMFANGEGPVFIESVKWLEDEDSRLQMAAVLAIGNFARNGQ